ncbi:MAG: IS66 family transposase [Nanoarchaeota archaeon]|nr:IS66 family transposase [Nanoarchaeota archaeon]
METGKRPQTKEQRQKQVITRLKNENKKIREKYTKLSEKYDKDVGELKEKLEKALLYIEELQMIVFRKKKKDIDDDDDFDIPKEKGSPPKKRTKESYRRKVPKVKDITETKTYPINHCPDCNHQLEKLRLLEFFVEDILPMAEWHSVLKKTVKEIIVSGYCPNCKKKYSSKPIPKQKCSLGPNIRQFVVFQTMIGQLSQSQTIDFAKGCLGINISKGEINKILEDQAIKLKPAYEDLKACIRDKPVMHMDETSWKLSKQGAGNGDYVWAMTGGKGSETVFKLGRNRGGGNIEKIQGDNYQGVTVTDDYNAYKNAFETGKHALCWAHPFRKFRMLANSKNLSEKKRNHCREEYVIFSKLYDEVEKVIESPFNKKVHLKEKERLMKQFLKMTKIKKRDPSKLRRIKKRLKVQRECYFVCVLNENVPMDNNKAERSLRHLVIKRKKAFGSRTPKGANILSILLSVSLSLWWKNKSTFFSSYRNALSY